MGRPARIDREVVLATALAIADGRGLEAVTMSAVAQQLGVTPMALYRHVANKADLLDGLVELLLTAVPAVPAVGPAGGAAGSDLADMASAIRATARQHPAVFPLLLQRPATTPEARRVRDSVCDALRRVGVPAVRAAQVERLVSTAVLGFAVSEAAGRFRDHSRRQLNDDFACLLGLLGDFVESVARGLPN
jgi:AcrR family transcriptional regulator